MALDFLENTPTNSAGPILRPVRPKSPGGGFARGRWGQPGDPGGERGIDILQEEVVDETDILTPEQRIAHEKATRETDRLINEIRAAKGDKFSLKDLLSPLIFGGLAAVGGFRGKDLALMTGQAFASQEKERGRIRDLDLKYNAAKKQRRFANAMRAIEDMRQTPGMAAAAAKLTVRIYEEEGYPNIPTVEEITKMFTAQDNKKLRKELETQHLYLRNLGRFAEAEEFEYANWDLMQPDKKLTTEVRKQRLDETKRLLAKQGADAREIEIRTLRMEKDLQNAVIRDDMLKFDRRQQGKEKPKDRAAARLRVRRQVDSAVLATIRNELNPADGRMFDAAMAESARTSPDGHVSVETGMDFILKLGKDKKTGAKPDPRLFATGQYYATVWKNLSKTRSVETEFGENITMEEVFPEEFILKAIKGDLRMDTLQGGIPDMGPPRLEDPRTEVDQVTGQARTQQVPDPSVQGSDIAVQGGGQDSARVAGRVPTPTGPGGVLVDPVTGAPLTSTDPEREAELVEELEELLAIQRENDSLTPAQIKRAERLTAELAAITIKVE